jgi:hypothetical protein
VEGLELGVIKDKVAGWLRGDHAAGMKFASVWNEIRAERGEDMIEEKEDEVDDSAVTAGAEQEISWS